MIKATGKKVVLSRIVDSHPFLVYEKWEGKCKVVDAGRDTNEVKKNDTVIVELFHRDNAKYGGEDLLIIDEDSVLVVVDDEDEDEEKMIAEAPVEMLTDDTDDVVKDENLEDLKDD